MIGSPPITSPITTHSGFHPGSRASRLPGAEDCGGIWGYEEFLDAISNKKHKRHKELLDWIGGPFDPEHFDVDETNRLIHSTRSRRLGEWVRA